MPSSSTHPLLAPPRRPVPDDPATRGPRFAGTQKDRRSFSPSRINDHRGHDRPRSLSPPPAAPAPARRAASPPPGRYHSGAPRGEDRLDVRRDENQSHARRYDGSFGSRRSDDPLQQRRHDEPQALRWNDDPASGRHYLLPQEMPLDNDGKRRTSPLGPEYENDPKRRRTDAMLDSAPARRSVDGDRRGLEADEEFRDTPGSTASRDDYAPNALLDGQSVGTPRSELSLPGQGDVEIDNSNLPRRKRVALPPQRDRFVEAANNHRPAPRAAVKGDDRAPTSSDRAFGSSQTDRGRDVPPHAEQLRDPPLHVDRSRDPSHAEQARPAPSNLVRDASHPDFAQHARPPPSGPASRSHAPPNYPSGHNQNYPVIPGQYPVSPNYPLSAQNPQPLGPPRGGSRFGPSIDNDGDVDMEGRHDSSGAVRNEITAASGRNEDTGRHSPILSRSGGNAYSQHEGEYDTAIFGAPTGPRAMHHSGQYPQTAQSTPLSSPTFQNLPRGSVGYPYQSTLTNQHQPFPPTSPTAPLSPVKDIPSGPRDSGLPNGPRSAGLPSVPGWGPRRAQATAAAITDSLPSHNEPRYPPRGARGANNRAPPPPQPARTPASGGRGRGRGMSNANDTPIGNGRREFNPAPQPIFVMDEFKGTMAENQDRHDRDVQFQSHSARGHSRRGASPARDSAGSNIHDRTTGNEPSQSRRMSPKPSPRLQPSSYGHRDLPPHAAQADRDRDSIRVPQHDSRQGGGDRGRQRELHYPQPSRREVIAPSSYPASHNQDDDRDRATDRSRLIGESDWRERGRDQQGPLLQDNSSARPSSRRSSPPHRIDNGRPDFRSDSRPDTRTDHRVEPRDPQEDTPPLPPTVHPDHGRRPHMVSAALNTHANPEPDLDRSSSRRRGRRAEERAAEDVPPAGARPTLLDRISGGNTRNDYPMSRSEPSISLRDRVDSAAPISGLPAKPQEAVSSGGWERMNGVMSQEDLYLRSTAEGDDGSGRGRKKTGRGAKPRRGGGAGNARR